MSTTTNNAARREDWIDIVKGIGILLVVIGHVHAFTGMPRAFIYMFHMPLFFFLSGYLSSVQKDRVAFLTNKAVSLMVPYVVFVLILASRDILKRTLAGQTGEALWGFESMILGGEVLQGWPGTAWFISCLFLTQQLMNYLLSKFGMQKTIVATLVLLVLSYVETYVFPKFWLPLGLNIVAGAAPFYLLGHLYRNSAQDVAVKLAAFAAMVFGIVLFSLHVPLFYDMKTADFGMPLLSVLVACGFIVSLFELGKAIAARQWLALPFAQLGAASLVIMFVHVPIYIVMENKLHIRSGVLIAAVAIGTSYVVWRLLQTTSVTRALFLGSRPDFQKLFERRYAVKENVREA